MEFLIILSLLSVLVAPAAARLLSYLLPRKPVFVLWILCGMILFLAKYRPLG